MDKGWIKLSRGIKDNLVWQDKPFSKGQAWIDLLLSVNHADKTILISGNARKIKKGQCWTSEKKLAERWGWSRNKVRHFLNLLKVQGMVTTESTSNGTALTIVNWGKYQDKGPAKDTTKGTAEGTAESTTEGTQTRNKKNEKENKEGAPPISGESAAPKEEKERVEVIPGYTQEELDENFLDGFIPMTEEEWNALPDV